MKINMFPKEPASQSVSGDKERKKKNKTFFECFAFFRKLPYCQCRCRRRCKHTERNALRHRTHKQSVSSHTHTAFFYASCVHATINNRRTTKKDERTNFMWLLHLLGISAIAYTSNVMLCLCACVKSMSPLKNSCSTYDDGHLQMHGVSTGLLCVL